jgi:hypothetical protein
MLLNPNVLKNDEQLEGAGFIFNWLKLKGVLFVPRRFLSIWLPRWK